MKLVFCVQARALVFLEAQETQTTAETVAALLPFVAMGCVVKLTDGRAAVLLDDAPALVIPT